MNMKKIISCAAAVAMTASLMAVAAEATDWSKAGYADNDPNTVSIISTSEDKIEFTATADGTTAKARITAGDVLDDADLEKVKSASWTITYTIPEGTPAGNGVGGGTYFAVKNSTGYWISPDYDDDGNAYWANTTYTAEDSVKFLLPTDVLAADSELVFMDWSNHEAITNITVAISDLKFFDADGNEIAQKAYSGAAAADTTTDTTADATDAAPAADTTTTSTGTGNAAAASVAAVMAVAGAAAVAARKRK